MQHLNKKIIKKFYQKGSMNANIIILRKRNLFKFIEIKQMNAVKYC